MTPTRDEDMKILKKVRRPFCPDCKVLLKLESEGGLFSCPLCGKRYRLEKPQRSY